MHLGIAPGARTFLSAASAEHPADLPMFSKPSSIRRCCGQECPRSGLVVVSSCAPFVIVPRFAKVDLAMSSAQLKDMDQSKRKPSLFLKAKWLILPGALAIAVIGVAFWPAPLASKGVVNVLFLGTNDDGLGKLALFSATNSTKRVFVRGHSEIELQLGSSNQVTVVQLTNVNYLLPAQSVNFSMRSPASGEPWRLYLIYVSQFARLEGLKYEVGWFLYRHGIRRFREQITAS